MADSMNKLQSRSVSVLEGGSVAGVRRLTAEVLADAARFIASGDIDVPGAITLKVRRERFDLQVTAEFQPFDPRENLV